MQLSAACAKILTDWGLIRGPEEQRLTTELCETLSVRCASTAQRVGALSGGNQQKIAIGKWLLRDALVYLLDEPTRGVDAAARSRIHALFADLKRKQKALVVVSSDLEELMQVCDRIVVMSAGRMSAPFHRGTWTRKALVRASFAGHRSNSTDGERES